MKIYISGKITGLPISEVIERFGEATTFICLKGHIAVNPIDVCPIDENKEWADYMGEDIRALLKCDAIYLLNGWIESKGARIECLIAKEMGMKVFYENLIQDERF